MTTPTPAVIAAQMAALADQLRESLIDNDGWDCDWTPVVRAVKATTENLTGVASLVLDFADASDGPDWTGDVYDAADKAITRLVSAHSAVDVLADAVANAHGEPADADGDESDAADATDSEPAPPARGDLVWYEGEPHVVAHVSTSGYVGLVAGDDPDAAAWSRKHCAARVDEVGVRRVEQPA